MNLFDSQSQRSKLIINGVVICLCLYGVSRKPPEYRKAPLFDRLMIETFAPIQHTMVSLRDKVSYFFTNYVNNINASKQNEFLKQKMDALQGQLFEMQEVLKENKRLKNLLAFGEVKNHKKVLASIVAWDSTSDFKIIRINKGMNQGVRLQSTVVTSKGLIGYVYRLTNNYADILTILDSNNRIDGIVSRVRAHGIIQGMSEQRCMMKYVTQSNPIILGDKVITSGLGNVYPKGIVIGNVTRIERESYGITQEIEVTPAVDFGRLEEVVVLVSQTQEARQKEWKALDHDKGEGK